MREPEFLPTWYPLLRRRRRVLMAQLWATALILAGLALWAVSDQRQLRDAQASLGLVRSQLVQTGADLLRLDEIETIKKQLEQQDKVLRRLGVHVPASRMISVLEQLMPPRMALATLQMHTDEMAQHLSDKERASGVAPKIKRTLRITLDGVAPTEDDLATFLMRLVAVPYFVEVQLVKSADSVDGPHLTRRFELTFAMDLDLPDAETEPDFPVAPRAGSGAAVVSTGKEEVR